MIKAYLKTLLTIFVLMVIFSLLLIIKHLVSHAFGYGWGCVFCIFSVFVVIIPSLILVIDR